MSPSGRLPFTVARAADDYPHFDKNAERISYGYYHGYTLFERAGKVPRFAFGHGLSYAKFSYRALKLRRTRDAVEVTVSVRNDGAMTADEVVLVHAGFPGRDADRPRRLLKSFERVTLAPGETKTIRRQVPLRDLMWRDPATHTWKLETGAHHFHVASLSAQVLL
jgi:beta-glucosidase